MTNCPHYCKLIISFCRAGGRYYVPSLIERHEFCSSGQHEQCPLYADSVRGKRNI